MTCFSSISVVPNVKEMTLEMPSFNFIPEGLK